MTTQQTKTATNNIKTVYTDWLLAVEAKQKMKASIFYTKYLTLRKFCFDCDLLSFTQLENIETECQARMLKLNKLNN